MSTIPCTTEDERRAARERVLEAIRPILDAARGERFDTGLATRMERAWPSDGAPARALAALLADLRARGAIGERENAGVRFSRVKKAESDDDFSIDFVHMSGPGPGHVHPKGELDLCFAVTGAPRFDGNAPGFTSYEAGTWHVPTVTGGAMDILYFLPAGAITFGPDPRAA